MQTMSTKRAHETEDLTAEPPQKRLLTEPPTNKSPKTEPLPSNMYYRSEPFPSNTADLEKRIVSDILNDMDEISKNIGLSVRAAQNHQSPDEIQLGELPVFNCHKKRGYPAKSWACLGKYGRLYS